MGRSVYADESAEAYIQNLIKGKHWCIGLIIGQLSAQKDFVLRLARTPEAAEDEVRDESEIGQVEELPSNSKKKKKGRPKSLDKADEQWLAVHARQVTRMLPGGLDVIGIFAVAPSAMLKDSQTKLHQMIFAIQKSVTKNVPVQPPGAVMDRVVLQVDSTTSKIVCSSIDVSNVKSTFRPAEWRYSSPTRWLKLESSVAVDVSFPVKCQTPDQSMLKDMHTAVGPFCQSMWDSIALVGGEVRDSTELLASFPEGKKSKGKESSSSILQGTYHVDFLIPLKGEADIEEPEVIEVKKIVSVRGIIVCRAFVQWKATVKDAIDAIKTDVVRSLCARCELLSEDLELTDETSMAGDRLLFDTPVRVFSASTEMGAQICDYMFQDEKVEEVTDRFQELLDLKITPESMEMNCEHPAREDDWVTASHSEHSLNTVQDGLKPEHQKSKISLFISLGLSALVAVGAAAMSYLFSDST